MPGRFRSLAFLVALCVPAVGCDDAGPAPPPCRAAAVDRTAAARFPLRVEAGQRHIVDAQGSPFLIHGDSAWSLIVQLTAEDAETYLENRRQKGFNAVLANLIEHHFADDPPSNANGNPPFLTRGTFSTPNDAYFAHADCVISMAAQRGILIMLAPAYLGHGGGDQGWYAEMKAAGGEVLRAYGRYLADRFKAHDNILWVHGGDFNPPERDLLTAVVEGIRDRDPSRWLHTFHGARGTAAVEFLGATEPWLSVDNIYSDQLTVVADAYDEYRRSALPFFLIEARYEEEGVAAAGVRRQAYQALLSGATGHLVGHKEVWRFSPGWRQSMDSEGARSMTHLRALFDRRRWWDLRPDIDGALLTSGSGAGADRAAAAISTDGSFALIYTPTARELTVDLRRLAGPKVAARWYDPTTGADAAVPNFPIEATGVQTLSPKGNNGRGSGDWILILDSVPQS